METILDYGKSLTDTLKSATGLHYTIARDLFGLTSNGVEAKGILAGEFDGADDGVDYAAQLATYRVTSEQTLGRMAVVGRMVTMWGPDTRAITAQTTKVSKVGIKGVKSALDNGSLTGWDDFHAMADKQGKVSLLAMVSQHPVTGEYSIAESADPAAIAEFLLSL